ncbi:hypothetical protein GCM10025868_00260 [Angustibacter aerolatus]|uniref:DUF3866 domain-containing protein n=1 Tax=Angustibacter aerolatus TaxID=1162965 RepID=A0ABQ6J9C9_9ACTN|nr:hypothetical protein GCM10025868_00260 [Angustibacter aerolatus]
MRLDEGREVRALAYPAVVGTPRDGDRVLVTVGALDRGLGTGGYALVVALPDRLPADPPAAGGHLVKARYTPLQPLVQGADEQGSPHHEALRDADDLAGLPVVVADLHSALPAVVAGLLADRPGTRVAYLMTDGGALPAWFSRTAATLREAGWLRGCVTVGQAFGGDVEAVTVHSGLLAARTVLDAEVVVVAQGPGNLGTGTRWGFSGVAAGEAVNAAGVLGGRPVASLRVSQADARERHLGVSHHSLTAYGRVALLPADVPVPLLPGEPGRAGHRAGRRARGTARAAPAGRRPARRAARGAAGGAGAAVDHGPRARRRHRVVPGRRGRGPARSHPARGLTRPDRVDRPGRTAARPGRTGGGLRCAVSGAVARRRRGRRRRPGSRRP